MSAWFLTYGLADVHDSQLLIGAFPQDRYDVELLHRIGVSRVLNLVDDSEYAPGAREELEAAFAEAGIEEERLQLVDFGNLPPEALDAAVATVNGWLDDGLRSYVHCRAGWQRSASVAAGVVAIREQVDIDEALERVNERKPTADPLPHQREDLRNWWEARS